MLLTKEQIQKSGALELKYEDIEVPELKGKVRLRELTAYEYATYQEEVLDISGTKVKQKIRELAISLLQYALVGEDNKPLFTKEDLKKWPNGIIQTLHAKAQAISGESEEGKEELEKN